VGGRSIQLIRFANQDSFYGFIWPHRLLKIQIVVAYQQLSKPVAMIFKGSVTAMPVLLLP